MVSRHPEFAEAHVVLADLYFGAGFRAEARRHLDEAVRQEPNNAIAWRDLGRVASEQDLGVAENACQRAADLTPNSAAAFADLAAIQMARVKPVQAEKNYRRALLLAPKDPAVLSQFSGFLVAAHPHDSDFTEAKNLARQALALDPKNGDALCTLGRIAVERREAAQAIVALEQALKLPLTLDEGEAWYLLSRAYALQGNSTKSRAARQMTQRINDARSALPRAEEAAYMKPQDPTLRLNVARLYAKHGEFVKAISQYQACLTLNPNNVSARNEFQALTDRLKRIGRLPSMALFQAMVATAERSRLGP
jgi:tetratricopeptide (TPR) repeat protein